MGQYYKIVNIDKREYLYTHKLGDGLKLMEFGSSGWGTMMALAVLLAKGYQAEKGDLEIEGKIVGSWAGDRIVISGDYADEGKFIPEKEFAQYLPPDTDTTVIGEMGIEVEGLPNLYHFCDSSKAKDISIPVAAVLCQDPKVREIWTDNRDSFRMGETLAVIKEKYLPDLQLPEKKGK